MWPPEGGHKYYIANRPLFKNIIKNSIVWSVNNPTPQVFPPPPPLNTSAYLPYGTVWRPISSQMRMVLITN